jgi:hypothetical protein
MTYTYTARGNTIRTAAGLYRIQSDKCTQGTDFSTRHETQLYTVPTGLRRSRPAVCPRGAGFQLRRGFQRVLIPTEMTNQLDSDGQAGRSPIQRYARGLPRGVDNSQKSR